MVSYLQNIAHGSGDMDSDLTLHSWLPYSKPSAWLLFYFCCSRTSKRTDRKTFKSIMGRRRGSEVEGWPSSCRERASSLQRLGYSFLVKQRAPRFPNIPIINMQTQGTTNGFVYKWIYPAMSKEKYRNKKKRHTGI